MHFVFYLWPLFGPPSWEMEMSQIEEINQHKDLLTELPLAAFIRYRKLLVPKMGRIDIHEKYRTSVGTRWSVVLDNIPRY